MINGKIEIVDKASSRFAEIASQLKRPVALMKDVGRRAVNELRDHFAKRDQTPNKLGGKRQHFWKEIRDATQGPEVTDTTATITIADPRFAQKLFGGTITAKNVKK